MAFLFSHFFFVFLALSSILRNLLRETFLPVCIFPNVEQIDIFQSHRRLDLLLDILILLLCRKFSFSERILMNAPLSADTFFYLNTFLTAYPATLLLIHLKEQF